LPRGSDEPADRPASSLLCGAVFLVSFCLISFEITLTRLLSVLLSHHYVFVVISMALLGLGLGGVLVHLCPPGRKGRGQGGAVLPLAAGLFALAVSFSVLLIVGISRQEGLHDQVLIYCLILLVPFTLAGVCLASVYRIYPALSGQLYGADLIGAGLGSLGVIFCLDALGGIGAGLLLGPLAALAGLAFWAFGRAKGRRGLWLSIICLAGLALLSAANLAGIYRPDIAIGKNPAKEIHDAFTAFKGRVAETRWSAFGRTDLIRFKDYPDQMDLYIDGTAGSPMYRFSGRPDDPGSAVLELKTTFPGYFPFFCLRDEERASALIIGPGGGRDILLALMGGVRKIRAVEVNRDLVEMVRGRAEFNGGIYSGLAGVEVVVAEGRHYLKSRRDRFDLIMLSLPVTNTSRSLEGYALTENFLFTTDSITDYLAHLTDQGRLIVVAHNDFEALRLLSVSLAALGGSGVAPREAMSRIYIVGSEEYLVFVLKKTPFTRAEVLLRYETMSRLGLDPGLAYFPLLGPEAALNPALTALGAGAISPAALVEMVRQRGWDISPVADNSPFFYKLEKGLPGPVSLMLRLALALWLLMACASVVLAWRSGRREATPQGGFLRILALFSMIGLGFMLIEIPLIQKFGLFLGQPVLSLSMILFSLLLGAGWGSLWSGRTSPERAPRVIAWACLAVVAMVLGYSIFLDRLFDLFLGRGLAIRLALAAAVLAPLGFVLGLPFPLGVRLLKARNLEGHIAWAWGLNSLGSVLGSALAIALAIDWGFSQALLVGAGCYALVLATFSLSRMTRRNLTTEGNG